MQWADGGGRSSGSNIIHSGSNVFPITAVVVVLMVVLVIIIVQDSSCSNSSTIVTSVFLVNRRCINRYLLNISTLRYCYSAIFL